MAEWKSGQAILGEYTVEKQIGEGGMGRVWLIKSNSTGRRFAVKQTIQKDPDSRKAFLSELQTWIDLPEHPNIVPCRFFRTVGDEIVIFTDYIEGGSLKDWIDQGKLTTLEQILDVAIQFAWGLNAIHERGLIHQDVKPGNVLMTAEGVPMVADFGLARARQVAPDGEFTSPRQPNGQHSVLVPGSGFMTKAYASPEQKAGQPLSRKTDIWSWGVSVLDIFMGGVSCPHGGHIAADVLESFLENGGQEDGLPKIPSEMADILRKCFARETTERWVNFEAVGNATKELFKKTTGRSHLKQSQKDCSSPANIVQHDRQGLAGSKWSDPREWLRKAYEANGGDPEEADTYQVPAAYSRKGAAVADLAIFEAAEQQFTANRSEWGMKNATEFASMMLEKAVVFNCIDDMEGCIASVDQCIEIRRRLVKQGGLHRFGNDLARALITKAITLKNNANFVGAEEIIDECIGIYRRVVVQEGHQEFVNELAGALMNKGAVLSDRGDLSGGVKLYDECIDIRRKLVNHVGLEWFGNDLALALMNKAINLRNSGDQVGAEKLHSECISIRRKMMDQEGRKGPTNDLPLALMNKANSHFSSGDLMGAVKLYDECIVLRRRLVGQEGRKELENELAGAITNKAVALQCLGDLTYAMDMYSEAVGIYRRLVKQEGRRELAAVMAVALINNANALQDIGDYSGAVKLYTECIAIYRRLVDQEGRRELAKNLAVAIMNKANALQVIGDLSTAVNMYDECIMIRRQLLEQSGMMHLAEDLALALMNKAAVLISSGDNPGALKLYDECIEIRRRLVEQEGRRELLGNLSWVRLCRTSVIKSMRALSEGEQRSGSEAYRTLAIEVQRTGRADLKAVMEWAQRELGEVM